MADLPTIGNDGILRWAPTALGEYHFDISVTDPNGLSDTERLIFVVTDSGIEEPNPGGENDVSIEEESPNDTGNEEDPEDLPSDNEQELFRSLLFRLWSRLLGFLSHFER